MPSKEIRKLIKELEKAGHRTKLLKSGHTLVYHSDGVQTATLPGTPSDHRSRRNMEAELRRKGFLK